MANNFNNFTLQIAKEILEGFESKRILSKNVNTQKLKGRFDPDSGDQFDFKRPTDYKSVRSSTGDVSGGTPSNIITGRASGIVQDYITVFVDFDEADQAIKMGNLKETLNPMSTRLVTDLELDFGEFMMKNAGLLAGTPGTAVTTWDNVARGSSVMQATGVPMDSEWMTSVNPFTQTQLASDQRSLGAGGSAGSLISEAHRRAIISDNFGGMKVMSATTLASYTTDTVAGRAGTLLATPDGTYLTARNTMTQTLSVTGFGAGLLVKAGETLQITGRNRLNLSTRKVILDETSSPLVFTGTVVSDVTLVGGAGSIVITGPAIFEATVGNGAYNTVDSAAVAGDVVTLLGSDTTIIQPNLFWHRNAFSIGSVPMKRLFSTDTFAETKDGIQIRVSQGAGFLENVNQVRVDIRPAYAALNPFFAGQLFG